MSKQLGQGFSKGMAEGHDAGEGVGRGMAEWKMANEMRVLFCALITAHKRQDSKAFLATVEIAKTSLGKYANFDDADWALFRGDTARRDSSLIDANNGEKTHDTAI